MTDNAAAEVRIDESLGDAVRILAHYFWVESGWEHFRAEFLGGDQEQRTTHRENARIMVKMLDELAERSPELRTLIMEGKKA